jgi:hypothetical protein
MGGRFLVGVRIVLQLIDGPLGQIVRGADAGRHESRVVGLDFFLTFGCGLGQTGAVEFLTATATGTCGFLDSSLGGAASTTTSTAATASALGRAGGVSVCLRHGAM